jgi:hypothetical protein
MKIANDEPFQCLCKYNPKEHLIRDTVLLFNLCILIRIIIITRAHAHHQSKKQNYPNSALLTKERNGSSVVQFKNTDPRRNASNTQESNVLRLVVIYSHTSS